MKEKKFVKIMFVIILIMTTFVAYKLYGRYNSTTPLEQIVSWTGNQEKEYSNYKETEDLLFYTSRVGSYPNYLYIWERDTIFKNRYWKNDVFLSEAIQENEDIETEYEDIETEDVSIAYTGTETKGYVMVYGFNSKEKPIENYTITINGEKITKTPKEGIILEIYEEHNANFNIEKINYK